MLIQFYSLASTVRSAAWLLCVALMRGPTATVRDTMLLAPPYPKEATYAAHVLSLSCADAFQQLNMDVEVRLYPPLHGTLDAEAGTIDGEVGRAYT